MASCRQGPSWQADHEQVTAFDRPRSRATGLLVAAGAGVGLLLTYIWAVRTPGGQVRDTRAMTELGREVDREWAASVLAYVSPGAVLWAALALTALAVTLRGGRAAVAVGATAAGTVLAAQILKAELVRPALVDGAANSWPSGHVAAVAGLAVAAVLAVPAMLRMPAALAGGVAVAATGLATVSLQWHRPSDVLASVLLAVTIGGAAVWATEGRPDGRSALAGADLRRVRSREAPASRAW